MPDKQKAKIFKTKALPENSGSAFCIPKTTRWSSGTKRQLPMRKNKTPTVIVGMRSGNSKLQNRGRPFKNKVAETV
ncbi:hypothetical protein DWY99_06095 [[Clostridium] leptum]|uniref:Uncharacterized protein n=1 Tax=[Clostridium] leptum TaxID=1535 RepID=A0A412AXR1_9FIRM|nr:hypothetical protein DWY99_06095 [[Clostridium] leptum]